MDVGEQTLAMAQRVVQHVAHVLAPDWVPLFVTDWFREYLTALLTQGIASPSARTRAAPEPPLDDAPRRCGRCCSLVYHRGRSFRRCRIWAREEGEMMWVTCADKQGHWPASSLEKPL
jgi:hypothetical protein